MLIAALAVVDLFAMVLAFTMLFLGIPHAETGKDLRNGAGIILLCIIVWYATTKALQWLIPLVTS